MSKRTPLQRKTLYIVGIPLLIVAFFAIYMGYQAARQQAIANLTSTLMERTARQASELNLFFGKMSRYADSMATTLTALGPLEGSASLKLLQNVLDFQGISGAIMAFDDNERYPSPYGLRPEGRPELGFFSKKNHYDYTFFDWFLLPQLAGKGMWTDPFYSGPLRTMIVGYGAPFYRDTEFLGVAALTTTVDSITALLASINLEGSQLILLSQFGTVVAHPNPDYILRHTFVSLAQDQEGKELTDFAYALRETRGGGIARFDKGILGKDEYIAYAPVEHTGWMLLSVIPEDVVLSPLRHKLLYGVCWIIVSFLMLFAIIYLLETHQVVRPLQRLEEATRSLAHGDFTVQIPESSSTREIYNLEHTFNSVVRQLETSLHNEIEAGRARSYAEEASKAKSDFLARMSHEIRTPMNGILGLTYLALKKKPDAEQRNFLLKIQRSGKNMLGILNDILDFSKIEAGKLELDNAPFRFQDIALSIQDMFHAAAEDKGLSFDIRVDPQLPEYLMGDTLRITQILMNLCNNALKFTPQGHIKVCIAPDTPPPAEKNAGYAVRITVHDTGVGIDPAAQANLFSKFMQADSSTTRKYGGTGLGLAICKLLAELMHGSIKLESAPDAGSTFTVHLRCEAAPEALLPVSLSETEDDIPPELSANARILVAEDNEINQEIVSSLLENLHLKHTVVSNGQEALRALEAEHFDLVLMDVQMPVMDGLSATRELRRRGYALPVLALTANALQTDRDLCLSAGMNAHIAKPIDPAVLHSLLSRWLSR